MKDIEWFFCVLLVACALAGGYYYYAAERPLKGEEIVEITNAPFIALNSGDVDKSIALFYEYEDFSLNNPESTRVNRDVGLWQIYLYLSRIYLAKGDTDRYKEYMQKSVFYLRQDDHFYRSFVERMSDEANDVDRNNAMFDILITDQKHRGGIPAGLADALIEVNKPDVVVEEPEGGQ